MSGPKMAVKSTASHMDTIAKEAHISGTSRNHDHRGRS